MMDTTDTTATQQTYKCYFFYIHIFVVLVFLPDFRLVLVSEFRGIPRNFVLGFSWNSADVNTTSDKIPTSAEFQKSTSVDTLLATYINLPFTNYIKKIAAQSIYTLRRRTEPWKHAVSPHKRKKACILH
jgi:hypothetical protein